jgi:hypothetical protein
MRGRDQQVLSQCSGWGGGGLSYEVGQRKKLVEHAVCQYQYLLLAIPDINTVSDIYRSPSHALVASWIHLEHACTQRNGEKEEGEGRGMEREREREG